MSNARDTYRQRSYANAGMPELIGMIPPEQTRVLDVGCGDGANLKLLAQQGFDGIGLTVSEQEERTARSAGLCCRLWDITQTALPFPPDSFDALIFCHVLEHLPWPGEVLRHYTALLRPGGCVYIVLPNSMQFAQRWQFLRGRFRYTETGIMDRTHLRFFDLGSSRELLAMAGLQATHQSGLGFCPMGPLRGWAPRLSKRMDSWVSRSFPGLFAFHILLIGRKPRAGS